MDLYSARQRAYAGNVANAGTPGYERLEADFAGEMEKAGRRVLEARTTHRAHMKTAGNDRPQPVISRDGDVESGGQVDLDRELVALAETKLQFSLAARLAALRISSLRASIRGGR